MNDDITVAPDFDATLFEQVEGPLVSLYLPVDDRAAAHIRLKELLQEVNGKLDQEFAHREHTGVDARLNQVVERFDELAEGAVGSVAVLIGNDRTLVYQLGYAAGPLAVVDDSFYVKPLLKNFAFGSHYVLLGLSADRFALIEGDFGSLCRWKFPEGLADEFSELFPIVYDGHEGALDYESLENHMPPYHGYKSRNDVKKEEAEKFFRYVDKVVAERLLKDVDLPVILVSLPEHQAAFRRVSTLPHLLDEGIEKDVGGIGEPELLADARGVIERAREAHARELLQLFGDAEAHGGASADPADIGLALVERKVRALFVAEDVYLPGGFNEETGAVVLFEQEPHERFQGPELADQFARAALAQDAEVLELPAEQMPKGASIAALYRY